MLHTINSIAKLSDHLQKHKLLENISLQFIEKYNLIPCVGVEIEFYLSDNINIAEFEHKLGILVKKEKGKNQFEIDLPPSTELAFYTKKIHDTRTAISSTAASLGGYADFRSKPFALDYGNSMHFHINFIHSSSASSSRITEGDVAIQKYDSLKLARNDVWSIDDNFYTLAARSLCHFMLDSLLIFLPREDDYLRLVKEFMAPTHVSFGGNNRTVAIRMPDSLPKRLEHRLPGSSVDPYIAIFTMLRSIYLGLKYPQIIRNIPKIHGNAFDNQYDLVPLPTCRLDAVKTFNPEFLTKTQLYSEDSSKLNR